MSNIARTARPRRRPGVWAAISSAVLLLAGGSAISAQGPLHWESLRPARVQLAPRTSGYGLCVKGEMSGDRRRVTVYGDGSPLGGRTLAVMFERVVDPYDASPEGRDVVFQGETAWAGEERNVRWMRWQDGPPWWMGFRMVETEPVQYAIVGRGVTPSALMTAAGSLAHPRAGVRLRPAGLPHGMRPLASASILLDRDWTPAIPTETVTWIHAGSGGELSAASVRARPQAINLVTAMLVPTGWRPMRGVMGFAGTSMPPIPRSSAQPSEQLKYRVWWDSGTMHVVSARGLTDVALDQAVADLGPLSPEARRALPSSAC
ncbi:hypothetical protein [Actinomadura sp. HBU206391]|uniref:hypothetical protein n=1 Tax=Actinomadura sp. HBU206391 TaxID=2731692 RepID=UPI00164F77C4|nr:hypothetical protein [Actinomadura sp. HBU206391]MBC6459491.1 hypothetical protein [Actinomadura sp. HBU206391]